MRYVLFSSGVVLLSIMVLAPTIYAQVSTADITGTVVDRSGGVVPGATITAKNVATGLERQAVSGSTGDFTITLLPPGDYEVKVEATGFSTLTQKVVLEVGRRVTLNFTVQPGAVTEVVTVGAEAPLVETTKSEIGGSVSPLEVKELPILDRNFAGLTYLVPGVRPAQVFDPTKSRVGNMSVNGGDGRQFDINVDGADNKDNVVGGLLQNFTVEGIQEFNVIINRYTAESGRTVGGIINVVTKSGTNDFHGSLFSLFQVSTFNKKSFFDRDVGPDGIIGTADDIPRPKPIYHRYHFGGSGGGPLVKDKLFVFGTYEHKREPGSISASPTAFRELSLFPLAQPVSQLPVPYTDHLLTVKIDHSISNKQNMNYRYGRQRWINPNDQLGNPFTADLSQTQTDTNQFHDFNVQHNYTISTNKVNSFNAHFQDFVNAILEAPQRRFTLPVAGGGTATNPNIVFPNAEIGTNVNVPQQTLIRKYQFRDDFTWTYNRHNMKFGVNYIYLAKLGGFFFFGANGYQVTFWDNPSTILANTTTYPQGFATPGAIRELTFSAGDGSFKQRPHPLALYFQDDYKVTPRLTLNLGLRWDANIRFLPKQLGDSPDATNRTIGVFRQVVAANPSAPEAQEGLARMRAIVSDAENLRRTTASWKEFQPRVGFAWDPTGTGKHVIRGGYGIAFDQVFQNLTLFALQQSNRTIYQTVIEQSSSLRPPNATGPLATFRFGIDPLPAPGPGLTGIEVGGFGRINDPKMRDPYSQQWSIGWAWEFLPNYAFSVDYYHTLGIAEPRVQNINPRILSVCGNPAQWPGANPSDPRCVQGASTRFFSAAFRAAGLPAGRLGQTNMIGTTNRSRFDSLNLQLRKRLSQNFMFQASYVVSWSNSWGGRPTSSYSGNGIAITPENQFRPGEYGPSIFDERHRFVISGHVRLPGGFEISPLFQAASARPLNFRSGGDTDGDGRATIDRVCVGSTLGNPLIPGTNAPFLCQQVEINPLRGDPFVQMDVRFGKAFRFSGERAALRLFWEFHNLFNRDNFCNNFGDNASQRTSFNRPLGYCGGTRFSPGFTGPLRSQFGFRFEW